MGSFLGKKVSSWVATLGFLGLVFSVQLTSHPAWAKKSVDSEPSPYQFFFGITQDQLSSPEKKLKPPHGKDSRDWTEIHSSNDPYNCGTSVDHVSHETPLILSDSEYEADALIMAKPGQDGKLSQIRIHAVIVADDDGSNETPMTPEQVQKMLDDTNEIYEPEVGIQFVLADYSQITNTTINELSPNVNDLDQTCLVDFVPEGSSVNYTQQVAQEEAAKPIYEGKLVVFFHNFQWRRNSTTGICERGPVTTLFSGSHLNFVSMGGLLPGQSFAASKFAHEAGHYFALVHTFWREYEDFQTAANRIKSFAAQNPELDPERGLDGDLSYTSLKGISYKITDTEPDPGNTLYTLFWNGSAPSGSANVCNSGDGSMFLYSAYGAGIEDTAIPYGLNPPRANAMSYYMSCPYQSGNTTGEIRAHLTPEQRAAIWRTIRLDPARRRLLFLTPSGSLEPKENPYPSN